MTPWQLRWLAMVTLCVAERPNRGARVLGTAALEALVGRNESEPAAKPAEGKEINKEAFSYPKLNQKLEELKTQTQEYDQQVKGPMMDEADLWLQKKKSYEDSVNKLGKGMNVQRQMLHKLRTELKQNGTGKLKETEKTLKDAQDSEESAVVSTGTWMMVKAAWLLLRLGLPWAWPVELQIIEAARLDYCANSKEKFRDHHLLLVTLLLLNALANEALPIFLDDLLSPVFAVLLSVTFVLVCGEILPSAPCRFLADEPPLGSLHGSLAADLLILASGWFVPVVRFLLCALYCIAKPIARILDKALKKDRFERFSRPEVRAVLRLERPGSGFSPFRSSAQAQPLCTEEDPPEMDPPVLDDEEVDLCLAMLNLGDTLARDLVAVFPSLENVQWPIEVACEDITGLVKVSELLTAGVTQVGVLCRRKEVPRLEGFFRLPRLAAEAAQSPQTKEELRKAVLQICATGGGWPLQLQERLLQLLQTPCEARTCLFAPSPLAVEVDEGFTSPRALSSGWLHQVFLGMGALTRLPIFRARAELYRSQPASVVLSNSSITQKRDCFAFRGANASLALRLRSPSRVQQLVIEQPPRWAALRPTSLPRHFSVFGAGEVAGVQQYTEALGDFTYSSAGPAVQAFVLANTNVPLTGIRVAFAGPEWDHNYICLYRIKLFEGMETACSGGRPAWRLQDNSS
ncbi:unnamed protein product [Durusdinium trenchii]|uniref:SUN domain-containing protein n=1 Tax=Durusdinium trenchii TaxID=1381693 RepID=A0ABP0LDJ6_9DINO